MQSKGRCNQGDARRDWDLVYRTFPPAGSVITTLRPRRLSIPVEAASRLLRHSRSGASRRVDVVATRGRCRDDARQQTGQSRSP